VAASWAAGGRTAVLAAGLIAERQPRHGVNESAGLWRAGTSLGPRSQRCDVHGDLPHRGGRRGGGLFDGEIMRASAGL